MKKIAFTTKTLPFLIKASRQKRENWLEKNRTEYEENLLLPLQNLARHLKSELGSLAPDYNFPQKGIGRLRRPAHRVAEHGGGLYKSWMAYSAARPNPSRFEGNPNLFFLINTDDPKDSVLIAGGLYMPSSRQLRGLREAIARDAKPFEQLFKTKAFASCFPDGFSDERISSRVPRGFDPTHPKIEWIKLQAFFVWHRYSLREFTSREFPALVARDCKQILRLNILMEQALQGQLAVSAPVANPLGLLERLENVERFDRQLDF